ncbi:hypothetical protein [Pseudobacteriovorax antillogorgiicola]|uniref:Uncharacterized protein n=1 Tax=Pseudobacteriovorax antillogorgiicola TaxID=1513793 RepID=A0A1Y6B8F7_9BACT|nr:hypothetical protein [Pseudobacteriovorax antillogorgiicola]TCS58493.1 hypothetical protein EDD56_1026 [Pseudobacteriovorax antillogorgiicola]SME98269.1 hypothetical protein SAMN06296036_102437 [Pseudobacteriovorax antillogorgiicola]
MRIKNFLKACALVICLSPQAHAEKLAEAEVSKIVSAYSSYLSRIVVTDSTERSIQAICVSRTFEEWSLAYDLAIGSATLDLASIRQSLENWAVEREKAKFNVQGIEEFFPLILEQVVEEKARLRSANKWPEDPSKLNITLADSKYGLFNDSLSKCLDREFSSNLKPAVEAEILGGSANIRTLVRRNAVVSLSTVNGRFFYFVSAKPGTSLTSERSQSLRATLFYITRGY